MNKIVVQKTANSFQTSYPIHEKSTKQIADPAITRSLNAAKKKVIIKPVNTKPEDRVDREQVMKSFRISARTVQYYRARQIIPYSKLDKSVFYYLPGILQILEQSLTY